MVNVVNLRVRIEMLPHTYIDSSSNTKTATISLLAILALSAIYYKIPVIILFDSKNVLS